MLVKGATGEEVIKKSGKLETVWLPAKYQRLFMGFVINISKAATDDLFVLP